jgi:hypothetical protein
LNLWVKAASFRNLQYLFWDILSYRKAAVVLKADLLRVTVTTVWSEVQVQLAGVILLHHPGVTIQWRHRLTVLLV